MEWCRYCMRGEWALQGDLRFNPIPQFHKNSLSQPFHIKLWWYGEDRGDNLGDDFIKHFIPPNMIVKHPPSFSLSPSPSLVITGAISSVYFTIRILQLSDALMTPTYSRYINTGMTDCVSEWASERAREPKSLHSVSVNVPFSYVSLPEHKGRVRDARLLMTSLSDVLIWSACLRAKDAAEDMVIGYKGAGGS